jgi:hypothetical protein
MFILACFSYNEITSSEKIDAAPQNAAALTALPNERLRGRFT